MSAIEDLARVDREVTELEQRRAPLAAELARNRARVDAAVAADRAVIEKAEAQLRDLNERLQQAHGEVALGKAPRDSIGPIRAELREARDRMEEAQERCEMAPHALDAQQQQLNELDRQMHHLMARRGLCERRGIREFAEVAAAEYREAIGAMAKAWLTVNLCAVELERLERVNTANPVTQDRQHFHRAHQIEPLPVHHGLRTFADCVHGTLCISFDRSTSKAPGVLFIDQASEVNPFKVRLAAYLNSAVAAQALRRLA